MADVLNEYKKQKLEWSLKISNECPLSYVRQQVAMQNEIVFCVHIPWPLLLLWNKLREKTSGEYVNIFYVDLLNSTVVDGWFMLKSERIEETLRKQSSAVRMAYKKTIGRKRTQLNDKLYKLCVRRGEVESIGRMASKLNGNRDELEMYKKKYHDLEGETNKLYEEITKDNDILGQEISDLKQVNCEFANYVEMLEKSESLNCQGKMIHEVGSKQKGRKLHHLKNRAQIGLWFLKSFGLEISQIKLKDVEGANYSLDYHACPDLKQNDKESIQQILFLLDRFCVGDAVYHELSFAAEDLPRSYLVKQLRSDMNKTYQIERTLGGYAGARINFASALGEHVQELLAQNPDLSNSVVKVKLSGDGARMSRTTNFMMFSFALLQQENVMSSKSNRTVAIINGKEDYETFKIALPEFFQEVNSLIEKGSIMIAGKEVKLEFFLGGDYKFLLMVLGLNSATANYACVWCNIHKDSRWDTSKDLMFYNIAPQKRTLENIKELCNCKTNNLGCIKPPLVNIDLDHVVPDELHLMLRITDRLLQNVIDEILERDAIADFSRLKGQPKGLLLKQFVEDVNEFGVTFSVWYKKNADGSSSNVLEYTSLVGGQKKILLDKLHSTLHKYLYPATAVTVSKIWIDFKSYYDFITDCALARDLARVAFDKASEWLELFCSLRHVRTGYTRGRVTPYMHIMCYHVPFFIQEHGCFKHFTGQGVEKNNDDAKRVLFQKSNKWDAAKDILFMENRQWDLKEHERRKGTYTKRNNGYWDTEISNIRKKRRPLKEARAVQENNNDTAGASTGLVDFRTLTVVQLRDMVKSKGIIQRGLSKLKKIELIALLQGS